MTIAYHWESNFVILAQLEATPPTESVLHARSLSFYDVHIIESILSPAGLRDKKYFVI